jgi:adenylosuccinate synthase
MNNIYIIVGLGFGDEGKGATVNSLCKYNPKDTLVIRHQSGHQVGHTVREGDILHPFSNFGSGTLQGVPTYWTEYCTMNPVAIIKEGQALRDKGITPIIIYNANAMVTTPFDIIQNMNLETKNNHGTVGVGFGTTIQRNEDHYHLYVRDLKYPKIRDAKLKNIMDYYHYTIPLNRISQQHYDNFIDACTRMVEMYEIVDNFDNLNMRDRDLIFEGGQGIMLDTDYGFFPNVTRSYTTSRNAIEFINKHNLNDRDIKTYYVTRAYQTRHGHGYMSNEGMNISYIKSNPTETNVDTGNQGIFRKSVLDLDILKYAVSCDKFHNPNSQKKLVITCLDQVDPQAIPVTVNGELKTVEFFEIGGYLNIFNIFPAYSDKGFLNK